MTEKQNHPSENVPEFLSMPSEVEEQVRAADERAADSRPYERRTPRSEDD